MLRLNKPAARLFASIAAIFLMSHAQACGPFFSPILVMNREANLLALPEGDAYFEINKLLPKKEFAFVADETTAVSSVELVGLSEKEIALLKTMRTTGDAVSAYEAGKGLPEAIRLYTAAAIAYNAAIAPRVVDGTSITASDYEKTSDAALTDNAPTTNADSSAQTTNSEVADNNIKFAHEHFLAIFSLPETEQKKRAVWAAYMLGKMASYDNNLAQAVEYFSKARALAASGSKDDLGLAVSSYGEEARLYYLIATEKLGAPNNLSVQDAYRKAIYLYAQQASYGSGSAYESLHITVEYLLQDSDVIAPLMQDPLIQSIVFSYVFSGYFNDQTRLRLFALLDDKKIEHISNRDIIAAFAYRAGRYDLAASYAENPTTPLAQWVNAKLALQKGDQSKALTAYAEAVKAFPTSEVWTLAAGFNRDNDFGYEVSPYCSVNVEMGLLQLNRNEYVQALNYLYAGSKDYWMDTAYVAERIVTTDELKAFVEQHVPAPSQADIDKAKSTYTILPAKNLRNLLARRLMRDKRYDESFVFFTDADIRKKAQDYAGYLQKAQSSFWPNTFKGEALYKASLLARFDGMELMGYEGAPDFSAWEGTYEYGTPENILTGKNISAGEKARFTASAVKPDKRFHYRFIAADLANQSANFLPPRSQAFAAVLCEGTHYLLARYPEDVQPLYRRYIKEGAYVPWAFGQDCPEPEFKRALFQYPLEKFAKLKRHF